MVVSDVIKHSLELKHDKRVLIDIPMDFDNKIDTGYGAHSFDLIVNHKLRMFLPKDDGIYGHGRIIVVNDEIYNGLIINVLTGDNNV